MAAGPIGVVGRHMAAPLEVVGRHRAAAGPIEVVGRHRAVVGPLGIVDHRAAALHRAAGCHKAAEPDLVRRLEAKKSKLSHTSDKIASRQDYRNRNLHI